MTRELSDPLYALRLLLDLLVSGLERELFPSWWPHYLCRGATLACTKGSRSPGPEIRRGGLYRILSVEFPTRTHGAHRFGVLTLDDLHSPGSLPVRVKVSVLGVSAAAIAAASLDPDGYRLTFRLAHPGPHAWAGPRLPINTDGPQEPLSGTLARMATEKNSKLARRLERHLTEKSEQQEAAVSEMAGHHAAMEAMCGHVETMQDAADRCMDEMKSLPSKMRSGSYAHENKKLAHLVSSLGADFKAIESMCLEATKFNHASLRRRVKDMKEMLPKAAEESTAPSDASKAALSATRTAILGVRASVNELRAAANGLRESDSSFTQAKGTLVQQLAAVLDAALDRFDIDR